MMNLSDTNSMGLLIATKNPGKARETKEFLKESVSWRIELISLADLKDAPDIEETGKTFEENVVLKAKAYFEWSGIPAVADDAGLEIDYLNSEPGVLSRRWPSFAEASKGKPGREKTDQELIDMALEKLKGLSKEKRTAHLVAVGAYYDGKNTIIERGSIDGYIVEKQTAECEPGYPFRSIFMVPKFHKLYQDLSHEEHEQINHHKMVYNKLAKRIWDLLA